MSYARWHWRTLNILARVMGIWFLVGGLLGFSATLFMRSSAGPDWVLGLWSTGFAIAVGGALLVVKPYRPDLKGGASTQGRRQAWWTGEPE
jgi:hypothetical protein